VVLFGTGKTVAKLVGYTSGGKTGTAQIYSKAMHRYSHDYNGSFMGFAPVTNPAIVVVATVNGTHGQAGFAAPTAGPVFRAAATEAMRILDVPRDLIDEAAEATAAAAKMSADDDADLADASLAADGPNILEDPEDGDNSAPNAPRAPNFRGMTMRAVLAAAAAQGLTVAPDGSGVARLQIPPPGAILHPGERIRVMFRR
jgi:cell division protein FtsI (penicillin-binding protein 3)